MKTGILPYKMAQSKERKDSSTFINTSNLSRIPPEFKNKQPNMRYHIWRGSLRTKNLRI